MSPSRTLSVVLSAAALLALASPPAHAWPSAERAAEPGHFHAIAVAAQPSTDAADAAELAEDLARYQRIADDLNVTVAQTDVLRRQIAELQQRISARRAAVGRVAAATYRSHRIHPLYFLAGAGSQDEALRRILLASGFAERQQQEIDSLSLARARFESAQRTLESLIAQQRSQQQALAAQRHKLQQGQ